MNQLDAIFNMIKDAEVAATVSQVLQDVFDRLGQSVLRVNQSCSEVEAKRYRQKIGDIAYILVFDILEPLYEEHPGLKPADWDGRKT